MNRETYEKAMRSGIPAGMASGLAISGLQRQPVINGQKLFPSKMSCGVFGAMFGLGTFMIADGDYKNGAGFTAVWSTLYLMANCRSFTRGLFPATLAGVAVFNAIGYATEFTKAPTAIKLEPESQE